MHADPDGEGLGVVGLLLDAGADGEVQNNEGETPTDIARDTRWGPAKVQVCLT